MLRLDGSTPQPSPTFLSQPIPLGRAPRGVGLGALDQAQLHGRVEVVRPERRAMANAEGLHQRGATYGVASDRSKQRDYLIAYLVAGHSFLDGISQRSAHEDVRN